MITLSPLKSVSILDGVCVTFKSPHSSVTSLRIGCNANWSCLVTTFWTWEDSVMNSSFPFPFFFIFFNLFFFFLFFFYIHFFFIFFYFYTCFCNSMDQSFYHIFILYYFFYIIIYYLNYFLMHPFPNQM